ncbi:MAG TPA: CPBP family intramembrane glutamic endopeptidase [Candidatus Lokiarchaeia archaeon]|nr:CPBP family intramembrane glutamic endopeptidase [Candidatus Lokiarchaeia archaeon]
MVNAPEKPLEQDRREQPKLSWSAHFQIILGALFIFLVFTVVYFFLSSGQSGDKLSQTIRYGVATGLEILIVLFIQTAFDIFFTNKPAMSYATQFETRARQFGLRKPKNGLIITRDTLLILLCALVPMDFLTYLIPGILPFIANSRVGVFFNGFSLAAFVGIGFVYNLFTGIKEEFVFRGYFLQRFKESGKPQSAWLCTAALFASLHVSLDSIPLFPAGPLLWFLTALLAGLLFGGYVLTTKRLLPVILAHGIGDFISSTSIWTYFTTNAFVGGMMYSFLFLFYGPMLVAGIVLALLFRQTIKGARKALKRLSSALWHRMSPRDWLLMIVVIVILWSISLLGISY